MSLLFYMPLQGPFSSSSYTYLYVLVPDGSESDLTPEVPEDDLGGWKVEVWGGDMSMRRLQTV